MFSIFKQAANEETVLQELSEGQLAEVAGGYGCNSYNNHMHNMKHKHHHHKHMMHNKWMKKPMWNSSSSKKVKMHW